MRKHRVFYDGGGGYAALLTAAIYLNKLPSDRLPSAADVQTILRDQGRPYTAGVVHLLGQTEEENIYWCGLEHSTTIVVRAWRNFLSLYGHPQKECVFSQVPLPKKRRWQRSEKLLKKAGRSEKGRAQLAKAAIREYAVFLTCLLNDFTIREEGVR